MLVLELIAITARNFIIRRYTPEAQGREQRAERSKKPLSTKSARGDNSLAEFTGQWTRSVHTHAHSCHSWHLSLYTRDHSAPPSLRHPGENSSPVLRHAGENGVGQTYSPAAMTNCQCWTRCPTPSVEPLYQPVVTSKHIPETPLLFKLRMPVDSGSRP